MQKQGCVYHVVNIVSGKGYVGQYAGLEAERRWNRHVNWALAGGPYPFHRALRKYGLKNFTWEVVWRGPVSRLDCMETKFIKKLGTLAPSGYNLTLGGGTTTGLKWRKSSRERASISALIRYEDPIEREKAGRARRGVRLSEETRQKIRLANLGRVDAPELVEKRANSNRGRKRTGQALENLRAGVKNRRWSATPEQRLTRSKNAKKQFASEEARLAVGEQAKENWAKPEYRAKQMAVRSTPEYKARTSKAIKKALANKRAREERNGLTRAA